MNKWRTTWAKIFPEPEITDQAEKWVDVADGDACIPVPFKSGRKNVKALKGPHYEDTCGDGGGTPPAPGPAGEAPELPKPHECKPLKPTPPSPDPVPKGEDGSSTSSGGGSTPSGGDQDDGDADKDDGTPSSRKCT